jgi:hypothetical protein
VSKYDFAEAELTFPRALPGSAPQRALDATMAKSNVEIVYVITSVACHGDGTTVS